MAIDFTVMVAENEKFSFVMATKLWGKCQLCFSLLNSLSINWYVTIIYYRCKAKVVLDIADERLQFTNLVHNHEKQVAKQAKKKPETAN